MPLIGPRLDRVVSVAALLDDGLANRPDGDAVASLERRWTFRALETSARRLAGAYAALGARPGDRIASLMPNRGALLVHYLACLAAGFVAVPLNYRYTARQVDDAVERAGAALLVHHADRTADLAGSLPVAALSLGRVVDGAADDAPAPRLDDLIANGDPALAPPPPAEDAPALIMFTSGSTGAAKGVTHTQRSFACTYGSVAAGFALTSDDILLAGSSMSHLGGLMFSFAALSVGARALVARSFVADEILPLLRRERPTVLCMLPPALIRLIAAEGVTAADFASLRLVRSGGDKVPLELEEEFAALTGIAIDEGYGITEAGLPTLNPPGGPIVAGSVGRPMPGFEIALRDKEGREVPAGEEGTMFIRSPSLMAGYWNDPEATAAVMTGGWLDSGDLMRADADGFLWFRGRRKQIIVHDGSNIFPQEVEEALLAHPAVAGAGVIGVHDLVHGENVRAYVALKAGAAASSGDLVAFARERIGYRAPEEIVFLRELPLNPTGKVDRARLKALAAERH